ncbi:MAG: HEAT repeat domain-containing protein [Planctomycetes bacterium]|nr:HEAT repeat domain-containing protein [Planctomycetota bacterium]
MNSYKSILFRIFAVFITEMFCFLPSDAAADENGNATEIEGLISRLQDTSEETRPAIKTKLIEFGIDADPLLANCQKNATDMGLLLNLYEIRSAIQLKYLHPDEETLKRFYEKYCKDLAPPCKVEGESGENLSYGELKDKIYSIIIFSHPDIDYTKADYSNPSKDDYSKTAIANAEKWLDYDDSHWCGNCAQSRNNTRIENLYKSFCALGDHRRSIRYWIELKYLKSGFANLKPLEFYGIDVERLARGALITVSKPEFNSLTPRAAVDICGLFPTPETLEAILRLSETGDEYEKGEAIRVLEILAHKEESKSAKEDETSGTVYFEHSGNSRTFRISNFDTTALSDIEPAELSDELRLRIKKLLINATKDKSAFTRESAAYALGSIMDNDAIPALKSMLTSETRQDVKQAILESLEVYEEQ